MADSETTAGDAGPHSDLPRRDGADSSSEGSVLPAGERPRLVRCPAHGLLYDAALSSGCSRCVGGDKGPRPRHGATRLRARPRLWLGAGLALSLVLGAIPAALYAQSVKNGPLLERRIEAEAIRRGRVDSPQVRTAYAEAEKRISKTRSRGVAFSALLWLGASTLLLLGWRRFV